MSGALLETYVFTEILKSWLLYLFFHRENYGLPCCEL